MAEQRDPASFSNVKPGVFNTDERPRHFRSLRWKLTLPLLVIIIVAAVVATYLITDSVARGIRDSQVNQLLIGARAASERATALGATLRREADRVAFTQNVPELVAAGNGPMLQMMVQPLAAAGNLDYVILGGIDGQEVVGVQRTNNQYTASTGALLNKLEFTRAVLAGTQTGGSGIARVEKGYALFTAAPIHESGKIIGVAVVGVMLDQVMDSLRGSSLFPITVYGPQGELLRTTLSPDEETLRAMNLAPGVLDIAMAGDNRVPVRTLQVGPISYQAAYVPLIADSTLLGVVGIFQADQLWYATDFSRHTLCILLSGVAAAVVIVTFLALSLVVRRLERVTRTVQALAWGDPYARTNMQPADEIGELGYAMDIYARRVQKREDFLVSSLRNQRRETARLTAVLASIPDGIIVQDLDGRVVLMNDGALRLLGSQRVFRTSPLNELTAIVTDTLGAALAPGVYSLGDPQRVPLDGKILQAQAAAVLSMTEKRVGTVIVLRDITEDVKREQVREAMLARLTSEVNKPVGEKALKGRPEYALQDFIHEVNRNSIALQRMISEIRDLATVDSGSLQPSQQALPAETLLWNVAREWQPTASASRIELHVVVLRRGMLVLGEERRLRWAIGNLVDNAVKYTPPRGHITLLLRASDDEQQAQFSIKDTGVGISPNDLPHVFTRFYRGKPMLPNGQPLQTVGTGQGLFIAKRVIEAHGGVVSLTSAMGHGSEVLFSLPLTANVTMNLSGQALATEAAELPPDSQAQEPLQPAEK